MYYRTRTYIAADWDSDINAVDQLLKWNDSNYWSLSFTNAHDLTQSRDTSNSCNIKRSLATRMDASKLFILIVGENTNNVRSGSCQYCGSKNSWTGACARGNTIDNRSYIEYECEKAVRDQLEIIVLYKSLKVDRNKCPEAVRWLGTHKPMYTYSNGSLVWNYTDVKTAFGQ